MTQQKDTEKFEQWMRRQLDDGKNEIDGATRTRLRTMRQQALAKASDPMAGRMWQPGDVLSIPVWQWSGAVTATLVLGLIVFQLSTRSASEIGHGLEDVTLLSAAEEMEFFEELEFYGWLHETEQSS